MKTASTVRLGYPCINNSLNCPCNSTFRLANYSRERFLSALENNLNCLLKTLDYNIAHGFGFFRISSDLVPFASHPVCTVDWRAHFKDTLEKIGGVIRARDMRISMHPDQFVLINAQNEEIVRKSVADLSWHADLLDAMGLGAGAKVQIHVGGVYGDKPAAIDRFIANYRKLDAKIKKRLVIENDDRLFSLRDCLQISDAVGIPVLFDNFHHECLNNGETLKEALALAAQTWRKTDGRPMIDFSHQEPNARVGKHAQTLDEIRWRSFLKESRGLPMDIMLEIKDKEKSALRALEILGDFCPWPKTA